MNKSFNIKSDNNLDIEDDFIEGSLENMDDHPSSTEGSLENMGDIPSTTENLEKNISSLKSENMIDESNTFSYEKHKLPEIPDYVSRKNIYDRHKMLEEALLTPELIKFFDLICDDIFRKDTNFFSLPEYLLSFSFSSFEKESWRKNFQKIVTLLADKNISLIKILEKDRDNQPIVISLLEKKQFNLYLYHKFNDYLHNAYDLNNEYRRPIVYNLSSISEKLKVNKSELENMCLYIDIKAINPQEISNLKEMQTEKVALAIDLNNQDWGEAVFPLSFADTLLEYLTSQIQIYVEDINNDKIVSLIQKKLQENQIELNSIKKKFSQPDPNSTSFIVFIRTFYTIIVQVYNKNFGYNNKKIKEIEAYMLISLIARQFILNIKMLEQPSPNSNPNENLENKLVKTILSNKRLIQNNFVRVPMSLNNLEKKWVELFDNKTSSPFRTEEWVETLKSLNSDNNTIKEVLVVVIAGVNYYLHRVMILPLFLEMLEIERKKILDVVKKELIISNEILKSQESWENFIESKISKFFMGVYESLVSCLIAVKPANFNGSKTQYWLNRFFFSLSEIRNYELGGSDLEVSGKNKRDLLVRTVESLSDTNEKFKPLSMVMNMSFEDNKSEQGFFILKKFFRILINLFSLSFIIKKNGKKPVPKQANVTTNEEISISDASKQRKKEVSQLNENEVRERKLNRSELNKSESLIAMKNLEKKFPFLTNANKIKKLIDEEHDNWNLKMGEQYKENRKTIDNIINTFILRIDIKQIMEKDFDALYNILVRNNPLIKKIKNQTALKNYVFYRILFEKHRQLKRIKFSE